MNTPWICPKCKRQFTRPNQRHACGTGSRAEVLRNRPPEIVSLYEQLEAFVKKLGPVEFVTRDRYVLLRSKRIFADLVITPMALRLAVHLPRQIEHALIIKVVSDGRRVTHVAKLHNEQQLAAFKPHLREAYKFSLL